MNTKLIEKCLKSNIQKTLKEKGYLYFTKGNYNLNIIGVRSTQGKKVTNKFDDAIIIDYNLDGKYYRYVFPITTDPGLYYMKHPINNKGCGILVPNQYKSTYALDLHRGKYLALCQRLKPVEVYRDNNKDDVYDLYPEQIDKGMFGVNIHKSIENATSVDKYSAACQVFSRSSDFSKFIDICKKAKAIWGNSFTYTLIEEKDLL